jgi:HAE1 family hydrophobic/amphiphilic exporter-1
VTDVADKKIKQQIESISGVGEVSIIGGRTREIQVWVDPDKLRAFNVTVAQVADAVRAQNIELPGGRVDEGKRELTVRTMGRIVQPSDFNNLVVGSRGTYSVKLSPSGARPTMMRAGAAAGGASANPAGAGTARRPSPRRSRKLTGSRCSCCRASSS